MRAIRVSAVGMVILALLAGLSVGVLAQEEDEDVAPTATHVTGTVLQGLGSGDSEYWEEGGVGHGRGMMTETVVEWSDPRLPSRLLRLVNFDEHVPDARATASSFRIEPLRKVHGDGQEHLLAPEEGPDGTWVGTGTGFLGWPSEESLPIVVELMALTGEGAYEGLTAMLVVNKYATGSPEFEGYIFEGALPPMPDPVDPDSPQYAE